MKTCLGLVVMVGGSVLVSGCGATVHGGGTGAGHTVDSEVGTGATGGTGGVEGIGGTGGSGGSGPAPDAGACAAADARLQACGIPTDQSGYPDYYAGQCGSSGEATCIADCVAKASCSDLAAFPAPDPSDGSCPYGDDATQECAAACFGPGGCSTPLVLSFGGGPVRFERSARAFDMAIGMSVATDWPSAETPWLAMDRNGNGTIDDASELFGSSSRLSGGGRAPNGFVALRELDSNGDGRITPADEGWSKLLVWSDRDGDRVSSAGELASLDHFGIVSIDLDYGRVPRCDARGNCEVERARFRYRDAGEVEREGEVIDVHLRFQTE